MEKWLQFVQKLMKSVHLLLVGMQNGTATLEDSLTGSSKSIYALTIQPSNHTPK